MKTENAIKMFAGGLVSSVVTKYRYENLIVMIGHMRSGTSVLSNVICEHPQISGFGEAHIVHRDRRSLGVLALSQLRRNALKPTASYQYDKILHSQYDADAKSGLNKAQAIFIARDPARTILSIYKLFGTISSNQYQNIDECAQYYSERLQRVIALWANFEPSRRYALTYDDLLEDTDKHLADISTHLNLEPGLTNEYQAKAAAIYKNAGDPINAPKFNSILSLERNGDKRQELKELGLKQTHLEKAEQLFETFRQECVGKDS